jgi:hypothetical protein
MRESEQILAWKYEAEELTVVENGVVEFRRKSFAFSPEATTSIRLAP